MKKQKKRNPITWIILGVIGLLIVAMAGILLVPSDLFSGKPSVEAEDSSSETSGEGAVTVRPEEIPLVPVEIVLEKGKSLLPPPTEEELEAQRLEEERLKKEQEEAEAAAALAAQEASLRIQGFESVMDHCESTAGILIRLRSDYLGGVVAEKNIYEELAPASMTKMLTALISAEMCADDLDQLVTMPTGIFYDLDEVDASRSLLYEGETVTARDMLYGILLPSGCDCCLAMAYHLAGSEEGFAELMNKKAEELGCTNSHFITCSGLYTEGHYSCAADMAKIARACYENPIIHDVLFATEYTSIPTGEHPYGYTWTNRLLIDLSTGFDDSIHICGGKTGYSRFVGQNLTTFGEIDGEMFLVVTMGANGSPYNGDLAHHDDHRRIWNDLAYAMRGHEIIREELPEVDYQRQHPQPKDEESSTEESSGEAEE